MSLRKKVILTVAMLLAMTLVTACTSEKKITHGDFTYIQNKEGGVTITDYNALSGDERVTIPEKIGGKSVTTIGSSCFSGVESLKEITLPETIQVIESRAFQNCVNLESIHLNEGLLRIEYSAFFGCSSLRTIDLPDSLEIIKSSAFQDCPFLLDITGGENLQTIQDATVFANTAWADIQNGDVLILNGVVFGFNHELEGVLTLPDGTRRVVDDVFAGADSITKIIFPDTITSLGNNSFSHMNSLESIIFQKGVQLQNVGKSLFADCSNLQYVNLGGVKSIGERLFSNCEKLKSVLAENVCFIGKSAFSGCSQLVAFDLSKVRNVGDYAFSRSGLTEITIPAGVELGEAVFLRCQDLGEATISTSVPWRTFEECSSLSSVILADGCRTVGPRAFNTGKPITVKVETNLKRMASNAFCDIGKKCAIYIIGPKGSRVEKYAYNHHFYFEFEEGQ